MELDVAVLDTGYLAQFAGLAWNDAVLRALHASGHPQARMAHGYAFQHLLASEQSVSSLALRMGVTQQAASKQVSALVKLGYIGRAASPTDQRQKVLRLTKKGHDVIAQARRQRQQKEQQLQEQHGPAALAAARAVLLSMIDDETRAAISARRIR